jgi:hypothetical protein
MKEMLDRLDINLPPKPYCTNCFSDGLIIRRKKDAIDYKYIQINSPFQLNYLILDLDYDAALSEILYSKIGIPLPNIVIENTENGRAHILFELAVPVHTGNTSRLKPISFAKDILKKLKLIYSADFNYVGLIAKNPHSSEWRTTQLRKTPYLLNELNDLVDKMDIEYPDVKFKYNNGIVNDHKENIGRNCYIFEIARNWAYSEIRKYRNTADSLWRDTVLNYCDELNNKLSNPLSRSEIRCIAKSISLFCLKNDQKYYAAFIARQKNRGELGGKKSRRSANQSSERSLKPWETEGISRATYYRRKHIAE